MTDAEDPSNPVGYKKPPRHSQFKPGLSGNAKGRPKGSKNFTTVIEEELRAPIEVTENGKRKRISKRQAIVKQTVNKAASGDSKATALLLNEARINESQNPSAATPVLVVGPEDQVVMENIMRRIRNSETASLDSGSPTEPSSREHSTMPTELDEGEL
jgi:Family of unknown function (DUF5681)